MRAGSACRDPHAIAVPSASSRLAPLADPEVADMPQHAREAANPGMGEWHLHAGEQPALLELGNEPPHLGRAEEEINLGEGFAELQLVALDHAPDRDDRPTRAAGAFSGSGFYNGVDRLLFR